MNRRQRRVADEYRDKLAEAYRQTGMVGNVRPVNDAQAQRLIVTAANRKANAGFSGNSIMRDRV